MKHNNIITVHHRLPHAWWGNLEKNNAMKLAENVHRAVHTVFQDDTPIQRQRRLLEWDKTVLKPEIYQALSDTLAKFEWILEMECYETTCYNPDKFYKRLYRG